jgi:hypothetical protein
MLDKVCDIRRVGINTNGRVQLDVKAIDNSFDWRWFVGSSALTKEMLAVALAALTAEKRVEITVDDPPNPWAEVHAIFYVK